MKKLLFLLLITISLLNAQTKSKYLGNGNYIWYDSLTTLQNSKTIDFLMQFSFVSVVLENKEVAADTVSVLSLTRGYNSNSPFNAVTFTTASIVLKDSVGLNVNSKKLVIPAKSVREYFIYNPTLQILNIVLNGGSKVYFYVRAK